MGLSPTLRSKVVDLVQTPDRLGKKLNTFKTVCRNGEQIEEWLETTRSFVSGHCIC